MKPGVALMLESLYLAKGVQATTAIEGNTLTLEQVQAAVDGKLTLPPSQQYLKQEVDNVLEGCRIVEQNIDDNGRFEISVGVLKHLNEVVLKNLEVEDHVVPGELREVSVGVGSYRGAPAEDLEFLMEAMCEWLDGPDFDTEDHRDAFLHAFLKAVVAHMYIAWIHPFGDGNGRTARLVEFGVLTAAGIPSVAAHLLSNHYNLTRAAYYQHLDHASRSGGDLNPFMRYAAEGFVDQLQEQLDFVHEQVFDIAWENYVHELLGGPGAVAKRQRDLVIALGAAEGPVPRDELTSMTPRLAVAYAQRGSKTLTRDINQLVAKRLMSQTDDNQFVAGRELMYAFTPRVGGDPRQNVLVDLAANVSDRTEDER